MLYAQDFAGASVPRRKGLLSSLGNGTVAGSYRYDSWQLQFWDTFLFFESIDVPIPTFKRRIFMNSWQLYYEAGSDS
jgi:hypothetical protein